MKLCHNCDESNFFFTKTDPNERCNYLVKNMNINLQPCHPKNSDIEMTLETQDFSPGTKIMYWAAEPVPLVKSKTIQNSKEAYKIEKTKNYGITKCRKDNKIPNNKRSFSSHSWIFIQFFSRSCRKRIRSSEIIQFRYNHVS